MKTALIYATLTLLATVQDVSATKVNDLPVESRIEQAYIPERPGNLEMKIRQALNAKPFDYVPRTEHLLEDGSPRYTNRLILEDSPYLIQHAHNPVDWHTWDEQAFALAKSENKPIFLSIGYSTCHWCHVMERESFENAAIADFINRNYIAIKVDRERHPDVDKIYMNALIHLTGDGGWPLSSFLTPDGKPFYSGNYYRPSRFLELLQRITSQWAEQQPAQLAKADQVAKAVEKMGRTHNAAAKLSDLAVSKAVSNMIAEHDELNGGFGSRPKFPNESKLFLMLNDAIRYPDPSTLDVLTITLDAMAKGGIYDQVGGGFHRYSVRSDWKKPHFEKMLYNQAHLARVYLQGWYLTGDPIYRRIAVQTLDYVLRDMTSEGGAFYSATDADSEGEEGKFFFWRPSEIRATLSDENAELAIELFDVRDDEYNEGLNILHMPLSLTMFADEHGMTLPQLFNRLNGILEKLYQAREKRVHPLRDQKIITAWNGMMISTLAEAGMMLNKPNYTDAAARAAEFIWRHNHRRTENMWRIHFKGRSSIEAQQEDYAYYAEGLLRLYDATAESMWLQRARELTDTMIEYFWDNQHGGFFMSGERQPVMAMGRPRDGGNDDRMPSGNSVALRVMHMLEARTNNLKYGKRATETLTAFSDSINEHPEDYGYMLAAASDAQLGETGPLRYAALGGIRILALQTGPDKVTIDASIPQGWHINSNHPLQDNLIPTHLSLNNKTSGWSVDHIEYPTAQTQSLGFQSETLSLFEGNIQMQMTLKRNGEAARILPLSLRIQACNDRVCLPPESLSLQLGMQ